MVQTFLLLIILIFLNAAFASAEIAVLSMNETRLKQMAEEGNKKAVRLANLTEQPARFLATIQVAITLAGFMQSAAAAEKFSAILVDKLTFISVAVSEDILKPICLVVVTLILAYFNLVFGELVPKRVAMKKADSLALGMSGVLYWVSKIFAPLVGLLTISTNLILKLLGINPEEEDTVTEEEIRMLLLEGKEKGVIRTEESEIIQNVFELDDRSVKELCTHRRDVIGLDMEEDLEIWENIIHESRHTLYPVYGENRDDIVGVLDTKDYFRMRDKTREKLLENAVDKAWFIPETMKADQLFAQMQEKRIYFAVLLDEYGGMSGIITLHDLMEMLVGDLDDIEEEEHQEDIREIDENQWEVQGIANLDEVAETIKCTLPTEVYDTFSGYVCGVIGRVPEDGEQFVCEDAGLRIEVDNVLKHRVVSAIVTRGEAN